MREFVVGQPIHYNDCAAEVVAIDLHGNIKVRIIGWAGDEDVPAYKEYFRWAYKEGGYVNIEELPDAKVIK